MNLEKVSAFAPLPIRVMAGVVLIAHGLPKFENLQGVQGFFGSVGIPPELALPIALLEVIGGIVLIIGILTRITSILFIIQMAGIVLIVKAGVGLTGGSGIGLELLLMFISISLLLSGPGRVSIERDLLKREIFPKASYKTIEKQQK